jgi:hypothetical protein
MLLVDCYRAERQGPRLPPRPGGAPPRARAAAGPMASRCGARWRPPPPAARKQRVPSQRSILRRIRLAEKVWLCWCSAQLRRCFGYKSTGTFGTPSRPYRAGGLGSIGSAIRDRRPAILTEMGQPPPDPRPRQARAHSIVAVSADFQKSTASD